MLCYRVTFLCSMLCHCVMRYVIVFLCCVIVLRLVYKTVSICRQPEHHWPYIETIARHMTVYSTMRQDKRIPGVVHNLGVLSADEYKDLLNRAKVNILS